MSAFNRRRRDAERDPEWYPYSFCGAEKRRPEVSNKSKGYKDLSESTAKAAKAARHKAVKEAAKKAAEVAAKEAVKKTAEVSV